MVQRKVANNKNPSIKPDNTLKTEKKQPNTKPILQNHVTMSKGADLKAIKMKNSWSNKRSDSDTSQRLSSKSHDEPQHPGKPPPLVTPNPKKPSPSKSSYASPNYMKSTSSSEARKEKTTKQSSVLSTPKLHKVAKILAKTSSFKKIRTLKKSPSFKHTRTITCSSTLKDSKFPSYLELDPGATEAEGKSVLRVCSYYHCSLNGHHHNSAPPLKRFFSSRRWQLKSQKVSRLEILSHRKRKPSVCKTGVVDTTEDFLVEIFVQNKEVATQVSESLSDGPRSEIDFQDNLDQNEDAASSEKKNGSEGGYTLPSVQNQPSFESYLEVESSPSVISGEFFCENSDIEWEEGETYAARDNVEILPESGSDVEDKSDTETENTFGGYLEEFYQYPPYFQGEIVEFLCFSDTDSLADSESTQPGKESNEGPVTDDKDGMPSAVNDEVPENNSTPAVEAIIDAGKLDDESDVEQGGIFSKFIEVVTEAINEDLKSYMDSLELDSDGSDEDNHHTGEIIEENAANLALGERELIEETLNNMPVISEYSETFSAKGETCKGSKDGQIDSSKVKLNTHEDNVVEDKRSEMGENNNTEEVDAIPETRNKQKEPTKCSSNDDKSYSHQELLESCNKSERVIRSKKEDEDAQEREFNPRGPNFLDIEPDPEAEKVDLRHQEMDDRKNAEEWMLDYALQKTVNQLAPARKKKVELLVHAFEAVLPVSK